MLQRFLRPPESAAQHAVNLTDSSEYPMDTHGTFSGNFSFIVNRVSESEVCVSGSAVHL